MISNNKLMMRHITWKASYLWPAFAALVVAGAALIAAPKVILGVCGVTGVLIGAVRYPRWILPLWIIGFMIPYHLVGGIIQIAGFPVVALALISKVWAQPQDAFDKLWRNFYPIVFAALYLCWVVASTWWAADSGSATTQVVRWALCFFVFIATVLLIDRQQDVLNALYGFLVGSVLVALSASGAAGVGIDAADPLTSSAGRWSGAAGDPNILAAGAVVGVLLCLMLAPTFRSKRSIAAVSCSVLLLFAAIFGSASRGGIMALLFTLLLTAVVHRKVLQKILMGLGVGAACGSVYLFFDAALRDRLFNFTDGGSGRSDLWKIAVKMWQGEPIFGVGVGSFKVLSSSYLMKVGPIEDSAPVLRQVIVHNTFLQIGVETGVVGLALFLALLVCVLGRALKSNHATLANVHLNKAIFLAISALLVSGLFITMGAEYRLWVFMALASVCGRLPHVKTENMKLTQQTVKVVQKKVGHE